jgi:hypothetical protein
MKILHNYIPCFLWNPQLSQVNTTMDDNPTANQFNYNLHYLFKSSVATGGHNLLRISQFTDTTAAPLGRSMCADVHLIR